MSDCPIFILGCPRSGTGLLRDLLRSHPHLTFPRESHFIPAYFKGYGDPRTEHEAIRLAKRILATQWIKHWELPLDAKSFAEERSFGQIVRRIYGAWARKENKRRWGDKTPNYVTDIPVLLQLFPDSKIVHIYRDGRDVTISWLRARFGPQNVYSAASRWKQYVSAGRRAGACLSRDAYFEVCYERLLEAPEVTMRAVCEFIGEPFVEEVLRPNFLERMVRRPLVGRREHPTISRTEIVAGNSQKWKEQMAASDRAIFESVAGDLLSELGYETEGINRRISAFEQLAWGMHDCFWWAVERVNMVDSHRWLMTAVSMKWARLRWRCRELRVLGS